MLSAVLSAIKIVAISAALLPPTHAFDGVLGLPSRTASQIELSSHTNCSAKQGLVWIQTFDDHCILLLVYFLISQILLNNFHEHIQYEHTVHMDVDDRDADLSAAAADAVP